MKRWNFQVNNSPEEISDKLKSSFGRTQRFAFSIKSDEHPRVKFSLRKRVLLAFEILTQNNLIAVGKIFRTNPGKKTDVEINFRLHPLSKLVLYTHIVLGLGLLAGMIFEKYNDPYTPLIGGTFLAIGILFWLHLQKVFKKHVQEYKTLISEILEF